MTTSSWTVYILRCADDTLYTGITNDLPNRLAAHESGKGAKYLRGRTPFVLAHTESHPTKSEALKREIQVKGLSRMEKLELCLTETH